MLDAPDGDPVPGEYVVGWIKRGPDGVIGTNKACAAETVGHMLEDAGRLSTDPDESAVHPDAILAVLAADDWRRLDELELARGDAEDRPRVKVVRVDEMLDHIRKRGEA